jgi:hypothetical protein
LAEAILHHEEKQLAARKKAPEAVLMSRNENESSNKNSLFLC